VPHPSRFLRRWEEQKSFGRKLVEAAGVPPVMGDYLLAKRKVIIANFSDY